jgi:hypothetical protein
MTDDILEAEERLDTIQILMRRIRGEYFEDENEILTIACSKGIEVCQMIERSTGKKLGIIEGLSDRCSIASYREKMILGEKYINLHNHPNFTAHSIADLLMLLTHEEIYEIRVISADRTYIAQFDGIIETTKEELEYLAKEILGEISQDGVSQREKLYKRNLGLGKIFGITMREELV